MRALVRRHFSSATRSRSICKHSKCAIIVHGGAWAIPDGDIHDASVQGVRAAAAAGFKLLEANETALDAVEAAVRVLEDDCAFDAGTGSVLNEHGVVEMDSIIVDGETLGFGAVACVNNIKNPVSLARKVMDTTSHCLLVGAGAMDFAHKSGIRTVATELLVTPEAMEMHAQFKKYKVATDTLFNNQEAHDTVK